MLNFIIKLKCHIKKLIKLNEIENALKNSAKCIKVMNMIGMNMRMTITETYEANLFKILKGLSISMYINDWRCRDVSVDSIF